MAPPTGEVPAVLSVTAVLASNHHVAVSLRTVRIFSDGVQLDIGAKLRRADASDERWEDLIGRFDEFGRFRRRSGGRLRVGLLLADGGRAVSSARGSDRGNDETAAVYRLTRGGGGGTGSDDYHEMEWTFWVWPLPPDGPVTVIVDWAAFELEERRFRFDGSTLSSAASHAISMWPDEGPTPQQASWTIKF